MIGAAARGACAGTPAHVRAASGAFAGRGARTVVISSHNLLDLERLCTHVAFVVAGKVVCAAPLAELKSSGESLEDLYRRHVGQA